MCLISSLFAPILDDELSCAGAIAKHVAAGDTVRLVVLADGVTSRGAGNAEIRERNEECSKASDILGCNGEILGMPDQKLATLPLLMIAKIIESRVRDFKPEIVYTHWPADLNQDHRVVSEAVQVACRPVTGCSVKRLLFMEPLRQVRGCSPFAANWYVDIGEFIAVKLEALHAYASELQAFPHPMSPQSLASRATWHGSNIGAHAAEAFELAMEIR